MDVFRARGFSAASIADLEQATGLSAGSLYKAFGDKRGLFLRALDHYVTRRRLALSDDMLGAATGREKLEALILFYARSASGVEGEKGCLVVSGVEEMQVLDPTAGTAVARALLDARDLIETLVISGQVDGSVTSDSPPEALASALLAFIQGLRVLGKLGPSEPSIVASAACAFAMLSPSRPSGASL